PQRTVTEEIATDVAPTKAGLSAPVRLPATPSTAVAGRRGFPHRRAATWFPRYRGSAGGMRPAPPMVHAGRNQPVASPPMDQSPVAARRGRHAATVRSRPRPIVAKGTARWG